MVFFKEIIGEYTKQGILNTNIKNVDYINELLSGFDLSIYDVLLGEITSKSPSVMWYNTSPNKNITFDLTLDNACFNAQDVCDVYNEVLGIEKWFIYELGELSEYKVS